MCLSRGRETDKGRKREKEERKNQIRVEGNVNNRYIKERY
jgi:hypothetical protein